MYRAVGSTVSILYTQGVEKSQKSEVILKRVKDNIYSILLYGFWLNKEAMIKFSVVQSTCIKKI